MGIRTEDCISCGQCVEVCEFKALYFVSTHGYAKPVMTVFLLDKANQKML